MYQLELSAITKIFNEGGYVNLVISEILDNNKMTDHEKRLFTRIVYGTVEKRILLDYYLRPFITGKRLKPYLKNTLRMGVYMLFFMNLANHHVVNELVNLVKTRDYKGSQLANGVLRTMLKNPLPEIIGSNRAEYLSIKYSYPLDLTTEILKQYPEDAESILNQEWSTNLNVYRINVLRTSVQEVVDYLKQQQISYQINNTTIWTIDNLLNTPLFKDGKIVPQDASSQKVAIIVKPQKNERILDACSAPGGKAFHLAALLENTGEIVCCDIYPHKLRLISEGAERLNVQNLKLVLCDGREYQDLMPFDHVLIDAPCSGLGVMYHKVDLKYHMSTEKMQNLVDIQRELLENLGKLVKIGGFLTYSTCTINKAENSYQIANYLNDHPEYEMISEEQILPHRLGDGFYICKLQRKA